MPPRWTRMPLRFRNAVPARSSISIAIVDERQPRANRGADPESSCPVVVELPEVGQRAEGDVELAAGPLADLPRRAQHLAHVGADRHRHATPAAAFTRRTSLPSRHTLISASSRSNSANTASNAARAAASSVVHALRCSSEPIATPARSTTTRPFGCAASAGRGNRTQRSDCEESFHQSGGSPKGGHYRSVGSVRLQPDRESTRIFLRQ